MNTACIDVIPSALPLWQPHGAGVCLLLQDLVQSCVCLLCLLCRTKLSKTENETANELKNTVQKTRSKHSLASPVSLEGALGGRQDIAKLRVGCTGEFWRPCVVTGVLLLRPALGLAFPIFNPSCCRFQCFMLQGPHVADGSSLRVGSKLAATHPVHACASVRCVASRHPTRWLPWFLCGVLPPAEAVTRLPC